MFIKLSMQVEARKLFNFLQPLGANKICQILICICRRRRGNTRGRTIRIACGIGTVLIIIILLFILAVILSRADSPNTTERFSSGE